MALSISQWAEASWWGTFVRESTMGFAIASVFLLFGIVLLLGGVFLLSLRLFGVVMADQPVSQVAASLPSLDADRPGHHADLGSEHVCSDGDAVSTTAPPFWLEQQMLAVAIVFHFTLWHYVTSRDDAPPALRAFTGILAIGLWFGVGVAGRAIGFF